MQIHPSHAQPDSKNLRADYTLRFIKEVSHRIALSQTEEEIHQDLVPFHLSEEEFYLIWKAASQGCYLDCVRLQIKKNEK